MGEAAQGAPRDPRRQPKESRPGKAGRVAGCAWVWAEIRLIIFFAAKDGEALYSQQKQDQELTVAQIMNSL